MERPLIALSIIFGNEEKTIERFINSFYPAVDIICGCHSPGTKQHDSTVEKLKAICESLAIPLRLTEYENNPEFPEEFGHIDNFGAARVKSFKLAESTGANYILWADIDDLITPEGAKRLREEALKAEYDLYICPYDVRGTSQEVMRERLIVNSGITKWRYPIHEMMSYSKDVKFRILKDVRFNHSPIDEKPSSHQRNLNILNYQLQDTARNLFYLHQLHFETNNHEECKRWGNSALNAPGIGSMERYEILINFAQIEKDPEKAKSFASRAFEIMPDRREALALMVSFKMFDKDFYNAHAIATLMMCSKMPDRSYWSLNKDWYGWKGVHLYTQTCRMIGRDQEANDIENKIFVENGCKISLLHATRGRAQKAIECRQLWLESAENQKAIEHIFVYDHDDAQSIEKLKPFRGESIIAGGGCVAAWNRAAQISKGNLLIQLSDDWMPVKHWDKILLDRIGDLSKPSVLAISDGTRRDNLLCMAILTRARYEAQKECGVPYLFYPGYKSVFSDNEFTERAYKDGVVIEARDIIFAHLHPAFGMAQMDATYEDNNSLRRYQEGQKLFNERNGG